MMRSKRRLARSCGVMEEMSTAGRAAALPLARTRSGAGVCPARWAAKMTTSVTARETGEHPREACCGQAAPEPGSRVRRRARCAAASASRRAAVVAELRARRQRNAADATGASRTTAPHSVQKRPVAGVPQDGQGIEGAEPEVAVSRWCHASATGEGDLQYSERSPVGRRETLVAAEVPRPRSAERALQDRPESLGADVRATEYHHDASTEWAASPPRRQRHSGRSFDEHVFHLDRVTHGASAIPSSGTSTHSSTRSRQSGKVTASDLHAAGRAIRERGQRRNVNDMSRANRFDHHAGVGRLRADDAHAGS